MEDLFEKLVTIFEYTPMPGEDKAFCVTHDTFDITDWADPSIDTQVSKFVYRCKKTFVMMQKEKKNNLRITFCLLPADKTSNVKKSSSSVRFNVIQHSDMTMQVYLNDTPDWNKFTRKPIKCSEKMGEILRQLLEYACLLTQPLVRVKAECW